MLPYRQLGTTDLIVSRICFGCWQLSPAFWGDVSLSEWRRALDCAFDAGINFIDTADAYGEGFAETQLGEHLQRKGNRDEIVLATKFYWNFDAGVNRFPDTRHDRILEACENSLLRLQTDYIDLYQIHAWDALTQPDEVAAALSTLRQQGKVRWFGVSNLNVEQMELYRTFLPIDSLQPPYSLVTREVEERELSYCLRNRIGVIAYSPLYRGLLGGRYRSDTHFDDHREQLDYFHGEALQEMVKGLEAIEEIAVSLGLTLPQLAIRWVLTHPALTSAIMGIKKSAHVETILPAASDRLDNAVWHNVGQIMDRARLAADRAIAAKQVNA